METPSTPLIEIDPDVLNVLNYIAKLSQLQDYELKILIAKYFADDTSKRSAKRTGESESNLSLAEEIFESISIKLGAESAIKNVHKCLYPDYNKSLIEEIRKERISLIQNILKNEFNATERKSSHISQARARANKILMYCSN